MRILSLWGLLVLWCAWYCLVLIPDTSTLQMIRSAEIALLVGATLNLLNWESLPPARRERALWALRLTGNFCIPFAVSLTSAVWR